MLRAARYLALASPLSAATRTGEMVFESIPGCILQVLTVLRLIVAGQQPTTAAMISIVISALTTGFTSAVFTFDFDVDPVKRVEDPEFYGMIPEEAISRTIIVVCLMLQ